MAAANNTLIRLCSLLEHSLTEFLRCQKALNTWRNDVEHKNTRDNDIQRNGILHSEANIRKDCFQVKSNLLTDFRFTTHMNIMILN
jgi:hypothetical protein